MKISRVKGFSDILPGEVELWQFIDEKAREAFALYNFSEIRIPILEKTELFTRSIGETTDIVEKEMYTFVDRDATGTMLPPGPEPGAIRGSSLTLRPEGTAGVVRAYVESEMYKIEPVRKLFYLGPMFRRERPQKGRLRQFYQIGAEIMGRGDPFVDAEILLLLSDFFWLIGLEGLTLELNSLGCVQCRPRYRQDLLEFLRGRGKNLCPNCQRRMERNPLRVLDCKEEACLEMTRDAPSILDYLCEACRDHFGAVEKLMRETGLVYRLNPRMVRGLDYYCRTTFEWTSPRLGSQNAVAAGGRYDGLVEDLGGPPTPGVGFAIGMERLALLLEMKETREALRPELYLVWVGTPARQWAFPVVHRLRRSGVRAEMGGEEKSLKSQMRRADKLRASFVLIVGDDELKSGKGVLRNMDTKEQSEVSLDRVEVEMLARKAGG
ncbi:MAG: histidine--tRNA ligase [Deltaproteobacteria bacterium]|nr:histidine--tRNA ligase [Deltaproteobacteria bacterium]